MPEDEKLSETIRELYAIVNQLERDYNKHDRRFTLDGTSSEASVKFTRLSAMASN